MALITFTRNYTDRSNDTGFQFEFFCDKCGNGHLSTFQPSTLGIASKVMRTVGWLSGNYNVGYAADNVKDMFRGKDWDTAYASAVTEAKDLFKQCTRCGHWVCPAHCWNDKVVMCQDCAPSAESEAASIKAKVAVEQMQSKARQVDQTSDIKMDQTFLAACPHCNAKNQGGKFCMECGFSMNPETNCNSCQGKILASAKFCPHCGERR